ncbi:hypothetical protein C2R93_04995 [Helicobacter pylori]|nr:hypothetical protein C2R93_04995 [Helicobacter pylori]
MEKVLAFFSPSLLFLAFLGGGVTYKPTLNLLKSPKSLAFFKTLFFVLKLSFLELGHEKRSRKKTKIQQHHRHNHHGFNC